jgi:hypothetical protein
MPIPLRPSFNSVSSNQSVESSMDYSFLADQLQGTSRSASKMVMASNQDASLIMELWMNGERAGDNDTFKVSSHPNLTKRDIARLSAKGFLSKCDEDSVRLTARGKVVVTTMVLSEPNHFQNNRQEKKYSEILASASKKNQSGYRMPKFATNQSNNLRLS